MKISLLFLSIFFTGFVSVKAQTIMNIYQNNGTVLQIPTNSIDSTTYTVNNPGNLATLTTSPISNATNTSASSGGSISATGGSLITHRGICWSTSPNPTTINDSTNNGSGIGSFTSNLSDLMANTIYYVRAYAINSAGTAYGNQQSFTTINSNNDGVTYNGYTYSSIVLGNGQEWMSENLRTANYRNGDPISTGLDNASWQVTTNGAYTIYNNDVANDSIYGKLYNWYAVSDPRHVCPTGWHEPTNSEWTTLTSYLGGTAVAGGKMKSTGLQYWISPNTGATNESGFSGLPAGIRNSNGTYGGFGTDAYWWESSEANTNEAWFRRLGNYNENVFRTYFSKRCGFSVRCLKD